MTDATGRVNTSFSHLRRRRSILPPPAPPHNLPPQAPPSGATPAGRLLHSNRKCRLITAIQSACRVKRGGCGEEFFSPFFYHGSFALSGALRNITTGSGRKRHKSSGVSEGLEGGKKKSSKTGGWLAWQRGHKDSTAVTIRNHRSERKEGFCGKQIISTSEVRGRKCN